MPAGTPAVLGAVGEEGPVCGTQRQAGVMAHTRVSPSKGGGGLLGSPSPDPPMVLTQEIVRGEETPEAPQG